MDVPKNKKKRAENWTPEEKVRKMDAPKTKKKRAENWASEEKDILRQLVASAAKILEDKSNKTSANVLKIQEWKNVSRRFNEIMGKDRSSEDIKLAWRRMKLSAKASISTFRRESKKTGGGAKPASPSQEDLEIMEIVPHDFVIEDNRFDSDAVIPNSTVETTGGSDDADMTDDIVIPVDHDYTVEYTDAGEEVILLSTAEEMSAGGTSRLYTPDRAGGSSRLYTPNRAGGSSRLYTPNRAGGSSRLYTPPRAGGSKDSKEDVKKKVVLKDQSKLDLPKQNQPKKEPAGSSRLHTPPRAGGSKDSKEDMKEKVVSKDPSKLDLPKQNQPKKKRPKNPDDVTKYVF